MNRKEHLTTSNTGKPKGNSRQASNSAVAVANNKHGQAQQQQINTTANISTPNPKTPQSSEPQPPQQPINNSANNWKNQSFARKTPYNNTINNKGPVSAIPPRTTTTNNNKTAVNSHGSTGTEQGRGSPQISSKAPSEKSNNSSTPTPNPPPRHLPPFYTTANPGNVKRTATKTHVKPPPGETTAGRRAGRPINSTGKNSKGSSSNNGKPTILNVILPPHTEKSNTNSSIDSQLFTNNARGRSGSSNFATYKVELETTPDAQDAFKFLQNQKQQQDDPILGDKPIGGKENKEKEDEEDFKVTTVALHKANANEQMAVVQMNMNSSSSNGIMAVDSTLPDPTTLTLGTLEDENVDDIILRFPQIPSNPILIVSKEKLVLLQEQHQQRENEKENYKEATNTNTNWNQAEKEEEEESVNSSSSVEVDEENKIEVDVHVQIHVDNDVQDSSDNNDMPTVNLDADPIEFLPPSTGLSTKSEGKGENENASDIPLVQQHLTEATDEVQLAPVEKPQINVEKDETIEPNKLAGSTKEEKLLWESKSGTNNVIKDDSTVGSGSGYADTDISFEDEKIAAQFAKQIELADLEFSETKTCSENIDNMDEGKDARESMDNTESEHQSENAQESESKNEAVLKMHEPEPEARSV